jgi:hypothetical protein
MNKKISISSLAEYSPVTHWVLKLFEWMKWLSPAKWLSFSNPLFKSRNTLTPEQVQDKEFGQRRRRSIELYMFCWWVVEIILLGLTWILTRNSWLAVLFTIIASLRIIEILQVTLNAAMVDALGGLPDELPEWRVRMLILSGINFLELIICFGIIYAVNLPDLAHAGSPLTAYYFSFMTQLTGGTGDVFAYRGLRIAAAGQSLVSILFILLVIARFMASLSQRRSSLEDKNSK